MANYFKFPDRLTVSEFQQIVMVLDGKCDYQRALDLVKLLGAVKEHNRYWVIAHEVTWRYFNGNFNSELKKRKIYDMDQLIEIMRLRFNGGKKE